MVAATAVLGLALAACGGGSGSGTKDEGSGGGKGGSTAPTVQLPSLKGQKLQVTAVWTGPERENFGKVLDEFEKRTGATVDFVPSGDDMAGFIGSKVAGGGPPDMAMLQQVGVLNEFAQKGWLKPLGASAKAQLAKNYAKGWQDLGAHKGTPYGVYFKASNKSLVWYNAQAFDNAGAHEPKTWPDFVKAAEVIAESGVEPVSVGGADGWTLTDWFENIYLSQSGPEKYDQLAQHKIKWTDPTVKQALTTLGQLFGRKDLLAGGNSGALQTDFPTSVTQTFSGGDTPKAAMVSSADFAAANITQTKAKVGTDAKVFPFPAVGAKSPVVTGGDVAVALKDTKAAQALLAFLASTDAAKIWAQAERVHLAQQGARPGGVRRQGDARDRQGAGRGGRRLPLRHVRPGARLVRRQAGPGRVEGPAGLPEEPQGHRGYAGAAGEGRRRVVRALTPTASTGTGGPSP